MATIKDIASELNISTATVSRVLSNDESMSVSMETRKKIFQTADKLGYTRHKKLYTPKIDTKKIAIIQWYSESEEMNDLYYYSIRLGIEQRAQDLGYEIIRIFNDSPLEDAQSADGIIAIGKYSKNQIKRLEQINKHLVFVDSNTLPSGHTCITTDYTNSVISALNHFLEHSQTKIGMITGQETTPDHTFPEIDHRYAVFKHYLTHHKLFKPEFVFVGNYLAEDGYRLMQLAIETLKDELPQAFFIANDALAIGALRALHENDIPVPERVSLISFNDTVIAKQVYPPLSSITVFTEEMGHKAMEILNQQLEGTISKFPIMIKLGTSLTLRGSSIN
ncbi:LacI family DNA-binding transcriptional regulator [Streptococcus moroccensis]|uniref:LacI family transcriptional regulator n=1 Tax=Streptococcus moroccensis TaxID=1451356 RepID=A0ABT9YRW3_9STRE|nr:LacI family DNA-binding transcriptional regulator [Streptococcus moroccensis]MDQ0222733.1 LacI family transcriptional regulator [Streptococcus moroccensis]